MAYTIFALKHKISWCCINIAWTKAATHGRHTRVAARVRTHCTRIEITTNKDTIEHVLDAVDHLQLVHLLELLAYVVEGGEVRREREVFTTSFWQESEAEVQLTVAHEHKRVRAVVGVNAFRVDEAIKLKHTHSHSTYNVLVDYLHVGINLIVCYNNVY